MEEPTLELSVGQGVVELIPSPKYSVLATEKMDTVVTGLRLLEAYYPKYVKMAKSTALPLTFCFFESDSMGSPRGLPLGQLQGGVLSGQGQSLCASTLKI